MKAVQSITRFLTLGLVLALGTACSEIKLSKVGSTTSPSLSPTLTGIDALPEIELYIADNIRFIEFVEGKLDENGNAIVLTASEKNIIQSYNIFSPNVSVKAKFKTSGAIPFRPSVDNYTSLSSAIPSDTFETQIVISIEGREIKIDSIQNLISAARAFTKWQEGDYGIPLRLSLLAVTATQGNDDYTVTGFVQEFSNNDNNSMLEVRLNGSSLVLKTKQSPSQTDNFVYINLCTYMNESFPSEMCN